MSKKISLIKGGAIIALLFILALILMSSIEALMPTKDTYTPILGFIPSLVIWYFYFVKKTIEK